MVTNLTWSQTFKTGWCLGLTPIKGEVGAVNWFKPSSKIFYWPFQGGTSFVDLSCFCSVSCLLCLCARLFICALGSPAGKGLTSWLSFVVSIMSLSLSPLVSWVRCGTWLYRFLIFAPLLTLVCSVWLWYFLIILTYFFIMRAVLKFELQRRNHNHTLASLNICFFMQAIILTISAIY